MSDDEVVVPLTASSISEGFQSANILTNHFIINDHDFERLELTHIIFHFKWKTTAYLLLHTNMNAVLSYLFSK